MAYYILPYRVRELVNGFTYLQDFNEGSVCIIVIAPVKFVRAVHMCLYTWRLY